MASMRTMSLVGSDSTEQVRTYSSYMATPGSLTGLGGGGGRVSRGRAVRESQRFRCGIPCGVEQEGGPIGQPLYTDPSADKDSSDDVSSFIQICFTSYSVYMFNLHYSIINFRYL